MKRKHILYSSLVLTALVGSSSLAYQTGIQHEKNRASHYSVDYISKETASSATKPSNLSISTPEKDAKEEGIAAEQIVVKITDDGYVTSHGDHFHYYNGKVPFDALFSEELLMKDPHYQFDTKHIVSQIKDGYIIKVNGHYFVYLDSASEKTQIRSQQEIQKQRQGKTGHSSVSKAYKTDDGYTFHPSDVIDDLGDAFVVRHQTHLHYIPKSDLSDSERTAAQAFWEQKGKQVPVVNQPNNSNQINRNSPASLKNDLEAKRAYMAKMYKLPLSEIKVAGDYFTYPHGTHRHALLISSVVVGHFPTAASVAADLNHGHSNSPHQPTQPTPKPISTNPHPISHPGIPREVQDKINYISQLYGIDPATIQVQGESLIWPHENHTHEMAIADIVIPNISDDPEADFEAELTNLAKSMQVDPASIVIEDGTMTVPHGDHSHTYKIKSPGWREYVKHKIPALDGSYIPGPLDRQLIKNKVQALILSAEKNFQQQPKQLRRIKTALLDFQKGLDWATNSTEGYLKILDDFDKKYIQLGAAPAEHIEPVDTSITWTEVDTFFRKVQASLSTSHDQYAQASAKLQTLKESIGYRQESPAFLKQALVQFAKDYKLNLDQPATQPTPLDDTSNFEAAKEEIRTAVLALSEDKNLLKRVALLNKVYDAKTISDLKAIQNELNNLQPSTSTSGQKQVENLRHYLLANQDDQRLPAELKLAIQNVLKTQTSSLQSLETLKQKVKDAYRQFEDKQHQLSGRITELLAQAQEIIATLPEGAAKTGLQSELEELKGILHATTSDKNALLARAQEFKHKISTQPVISEVLPETNETPITTTSDIPTDELKKQIQAIIDFINTNRRNIETTPVSLKVQLLNKADDLKTKSKNETENLQEVYQQLQELKSQIEPHIQTNSISISSSTDDWTSGW
ncbi:pneumococcal-type histidine triad protein [Streptococcus gallolyticus]|nr:pneumococcal-type histidine triad protein [Streptococcus gallolyticus]MBY5042177.1 pneumococcal-type histidine triad protein [Streptococcus gallolyticus]